MTLLNQLIIGFVMLPFYYHILLGIAIGATIVLLIRL